MFCFKIYSYSWQKLLAFQKWQYISSFILCYRIILSYKPVLNIILNYTIDILRIRKCVTLLCTLDYIVSVQPYTIFSFCLLHCVIGILVRFKYLNINWTVGHMLPSHEKPSLNLLKKHAYHLETLNLAL